MKTLLYISALLASFGALASPSVPTIEQYWLDNDIQSRFSNTRPYDPSSNTVTFDAGGLSEGGHALHYRLATQDGDKVMWGRPVTKYFYVPVAEENKDKSNSLPTAYRLFLNDDVVAQGPISDASSITLTPDFPESFVLGSVTSRDFKFLLGEKKISMTASGRISYAVQLMSGQNEWGAPFYKEIQEEVTTKLPFDSIQVPGRYSFDKVDNNNFKAYRLRNNYSDYLYVEPSQDCKMSVFYVNESYSSNLGHSGYYELKKGETTRISTYSTGYDIIAVVYDTPTDKDNAAASVDLNIMLEDHKVPQPVVNLNYDTWEVTMSCPDHRASIWYSTDGSHPTVGGASTYYSGPFVLDKFTRVRAYAVLEDWYGIEASDEVDMQYGSAHLKIPAPELKFAGGLDNDEFVLTNRIEDVTMYYAFGNDDLDDETLRIKFDGTPFKIENGTRIKAFAEKENLTSSDPLNRYVYLSDFVTSAPSRSSTDSEGEDYEWWSDRKEKLSLHVPEGTAFYRILKGKQTFDPAEEIDKSQWTEYKRDEYNDGWIVLPGGAYSGNQTVQVFAESENKARSSITDIYTDWISARTPRVEYNNYQLKLATDVPDGVIKYNFGYFDDSSAMTYVTDTLPNGLNVRDQWLVSARVEAVGYSPSSTIQINRDNYNIAQPSIEFREDGYLHVEIEDEEANLVVTTQPQQATEQVSKNHVRLIPEYNVVVEAYATKWGYNNSSVSQRTPIGKPEVNVDGYRVYIHDPNYGAEIFYTLNGEKPVREQNDSNFYYKGEFYLDHATNVRAVAFRDYEIPAEADIARVLDQTEMPQVVFNYSPVANEDGSLEKKKVKFTCSTPGAKIWYSLDRGLSDTQRTEYDESKDWDGIDVTGVDYIYAYAEADGFRRSEQISRNTSGGYLSEPNMSIEDGLLTIWHDDNTVEIKPTFRQEGMDWDYTPEDYKYDKETNRITCTPLYNTTVLAKVEKQGYVSSSDRTMSPISKPRINVDGNRVNIEYYWDEIYYTLDGSMPTKESTRYEGDFETKACTVRAVKFAGNGIPAEADPVKVLDRAEAPQVVFNFDRSKEQQKVKLTCNTPNAKIYYTLDQSLYDEYKKLYDPNETPDGIDVAGKSYLYAYAEADGFRRSDETFRYMSDGILPQPVIEVVGDGEVTISHDDPTLRIEAKFFDQIRNEDYWPEDYNYDEETNKISATVRPSTVVRAHTTKWGYYDSSDSERYPCDRPTINVDGYYVWIDSWYGEIFYTLDGSTPTKQSKFYEGSFETGPCTVRAVRFSENEIPGEAVPVKVMDQAAKPEVVFNYSNAVVEGGEGEESKVVEVKKVKFVCPTPNARIYYSLGRSINDNTRVLFDPEANSEGIDVSEYRTIYAYAEADDYRRSETISRNTDDGYLSAPSINVYDGVVEITHSDPTVTIVPKFTPEQQFSYVKNDSTNVVTCKVLYGTVVSAYVQKDGCFSSSSVERTPLDVPTIRLENDYVYIDHYWRDEVFYTLDGSVPSKESTRYEDNAFLADNCTVNAVAFRDGEIPAQAEALRVLPKAAKPKAVYNFDRSKGKQKIKLTSDTANAKIYYSLSNSLYDGSRIEYDPASDGIDVSGIDYSYDRYIYAYAEADGFRRSEEFYVNFNEAYLSSPNIDVEGDGIVTISHSDPTVRIVATFFDGKEYYTPEDYESSGDEENNSVKATVRYNTVVKAHVEKDGFYASADNSREPLPTPNIYVDGYSVWMDYSWGELFYTADGSTPTRESSPYDGRFNAKAGTIRAVIFSEGSIPSEADPAMVMDQAAVPEVIFNFSRTKDEAGEIKEQRKIKFTSSTPNAKIYYALDRSLTDSSRKLYDPSADADGVDVTDINYLYAYAEADGFRRSNETERIYMRDANLSSPDISYSNGVVEISHSDPTVTIVPVFMVNGVEVTPGDLKFSKVGNTSKATASVGYNTVVKANVQKTGYFDSEVSTMNPLNKPTIVVNDYNVYIDYPYWGEVYYTDDGSLPTPATGIPYTGSFDSNACTIRAAAFADGNIPSEADPAKVLDPAAKPEIDIDNGFAKLTSATPGAKIWYSLDQGIGAGTRKEYNTEQLPDGIDISEVNTIYAYAEADGFRQSETLSFYKGEFTLEAPSLEYSNGYVTADHDDDEVIIRFSDDEGNPLQAETDNARKVKAEYNKTVVAYAYRKGWVNSRSVQVKHTNAPTITANLFDISIKGKSGQTLRYTTDGSQPTASSKEYTAPFHVTSSCTVRAAAFVDDQIPSEAEALQVNYRKSKAPAVAAYDGRYLTLSAESGSTIKYLIGTTGSVENTGVVASGKIDVEGLKTVRALAQRTDADDSEVFSFTPEYYANESDVYTSKAGVLKDAFDWCSDLSGFSSLAVHGVMLGSDAEDNGDYEFLRSFPYLRHLDLSKVTDENVPAGALASKQLVSVTLPETLKSTGEFVFGEDNSTLCAVVLPAAGFAPVHLLDGINNPNLLLYTKSANYVSDLIAAADGVVKNVVVLGAVNSSNRAESVTLTHADAFYAPREFNAQKINFTREFTKQTQIGGFGSGWETMVVPFDVQTIACAGKTLKPFGEADTDRGECPFWLFEAGETDWMDSRSIMANTPYLLAMPNNPLYADEFVVNGDVTFSANNVTVAVTPDEEDMTFAFGTGKFIAGNYGLIDKDDDVLAINDEVFNYHQTDFQPGGIFVAGQKDVVPFECYVLSQGVSAMPVFDQSSIDEIMDEFGTHVWGENYCIYIRSAISLKVRIYDSVGQLIRSVDVKAGETVQVSDITPGIYFVGSNKILVKG